MNPNSNTNQVPPENWISMGEAALLSPYSAQYLSLRARKGRLYSRKIDNTWYTTREALEEYMKKQMLRTQALENHLNGNGHKSVVPATVPQVVASAVLTVPIVNPEAYEPTLKHFRSYESDARDHHARTAQTFVPPVSKEFQPVTEQKISEPVLVPVKKSGKNISTSRAVLLGAMATLLLFSSFQTPLVKGVFDKPINLVKDKVSEAKGAIAFYMNLNKNEILLINKEGTVAITGSIGTNTPYGNGVVPIVLETITGSSTPSSGSAYTLAFVTSNGNITTEDVHLEGEVEVGQTLMVKGATKLLSALEIDGNLKVFGNAEFNQALSVLGPAYFHALLTAEDILAKGNLEVKKNIEATGSITAGRSIVGKSGSFTSLSSRGDFSADGEINLGNDDDTISIDSSNFTLDSTGNAHIFGTLTLDGALTGSTATFTSATSTNFFSTNATFTNLTATNQTITDLIFTNATGTNATTTNFFATTASSTNLFATIGNIGTLTAGPITSGLINGQTITSAANFTGTLTAADNITVSSASTKGLVVNSTDGASFRGLVLQHSGTAVAGMEVLPNTGEIKIGGYQTITDYFPVIYSDGVAALTFGLGATPSASFVGNVGIGTTSPDMLLHVAGRAKFGDEIRFADDNENEDWHINVTAGDGLKIVETGVDTRLTIKEGGNVGIGTVSPDTALTVSKAVTATDFSTPIARFNGQTYGAGRFYGIGFNYDTGHTNTPVALGYIPENGAGYTNGAIAFATRSVTTDTSPSERMRIRADGKVSIGTNTAAMTGLLNLNAPAGLSSVIQFAINSGGTKGYIGQAFEAGTLSSSAAVDDIVVRAQNNLIFATGGDTSRLYIDTTGNVTLSDLAGSGNRCLYADSTGQINVKGFDCGSASGGDNLGDHTATQAVRLNGNWLSNDGGAEGIRVDNSGNVGIGIAGSTYQLEVINNIGITASEAAGTNPTLVIRDNSTAQTRASAVNFINSAGAAQGQISYIQSTGTMGFNTNAARAMTILSSGNVGIGTTTPGHKLNVSDGTATMFFNPNGGASKFDIGTIGAHSLGFYTNSTEVMRILSGGNVGIGTTDPGYKLDIAAPDATDFDLGVAPLTTILGGRIENTGTADGSIIGQHLVVNGSSSGRAWGGMLLEQVPTDTSKLHFYTEAANSRTVKMTIDGSGNVGIGTTAPGSKLHILDAAGGTTGTIQIGGASFYGLIQYEAGVSGAINYDSAGGGGGGHIFKVGGSSKVTIDGSGNVGIGMTGPLAKLDIGGDTSTYAGMAKIYLTDVNANAASRNWSIGNGGSAFGNLTFAVSAAADGNAGDATATNVMVLSSAGNVGIGTIGPDSKLHINNAVAAGTDNFLLRIQNTTTESDSRAGIAFLDNSSTGASMSGAGIQVSNNGVDGAGHLTFGRILAGTYTENVRFQSGGNVGIGTTNPSTSVLQIENSGSGLFSVQRTGYDRYGFLQSVGTGLHLYNYTDARTDMFIDGSGNIGIAMTNPSVALDVTGDIEYTGTITDVSDERLKENIQDLSNPLALLSNIKGKSFNMIGSDKLDYGFIAQNVQEYLPAAVSIVDPETGYMGVSYLDFIPWLVEGVKELDIRTASSTEVMLGSIDTLDLRLSEMENILASSTALTLDATTTDIITTSVLDKLSASVSNAVVYMKKLALEALTIGSRERPSGITLYDKVTGDPYCLEIINGQTTSTIGECGSQPEPAPEPEPAPVEEPVGETATSTEEVIIEEEAPPAEPESTPTPEPEPAPTPTPEPEPAPEPATEPTPEPIVESPYEPAQQP